MEVTSTTNKGILKTFKCSNIGIPCMLLKDMNPEEKANIRTKHTLKKNNSSVIKPHQSLKSASIENSLL